jgi:EAL domain-containing protein (putative c-di-GMP-specific phosphodiesterase class I)
MTWPEHLRIAVNLSAVQFRSSSVVDIVDEILAETGLAAERLELEITESALIEDDAGAQATLEWPCAAGGCVWRWTTLGPGIRLWPTCAGSRWTS